MEKLELNNNSSFGTMLTLFDKKLYSYPLSMFVSSRDTIKSAAPLNVFKGDVGPYISHKMDSVIIVTMRHFVRSAFWK